MFGVNNKDIQVKSMTTFWCLYYYFLWTYFTPFLMFLLLTLNRQMFAGTLTKGNEIFTWYLLYHARKTHLHDRIIFIRVKKQSAHYSAFTFTWNSSSLTGRHILGLLLMRHSCYLNWIQTAEILCCSRTIPMKTLKFSRTHYHILQKT